VTFKAEPIQNGISLVDKDGRPSMQFQRLWMELQTTMVARIQAEFGLTAATEAAVEAAETATTAAAAATGAATDAQTAADAITSETALIASFPDDFTAPLISADSTGVVTIASHNRKYGNGLTVAVTGDTVATGLPALDVARIYYDDATRGGGAVSYQFTTDPAVAAQSGNRHSVGAVEIPAAGTQDGGQVYPPAR